MVYTEIPGKDDSQVAVHCQSAAP
ncbi:hypothetical protein CCACVL1_23028 [Corchorus capsularis]|uniref:Uncharacterized protein n=1 Tax=Corchorus capsularis TaxID=210143 RepID=A0A1R3GVF9_COCAP|nr:hypothetical protein CCACVL1_23028 [Corchorus capsularis]